MNLDLHAKSPFERVRLFLKLYSLPVFVAVFGIATYCMAYEKAYEYKTSNQPSLTLAQVQKPQITQEVQMIQEPQALPEIKNEVLGEYLVDATALNVRSKASTQAKINAKLYRSDSVEVIGVEGEWAQLENGWVLLKYLSRA
ncbi:MAG TPA: SH3 domain-containing protein [Candidatus Helicobacter avistercoris]|nr:SH3 domain-containing protein [Candidatus Helicobacter avistercoris]